VRVFVGKKIINRTHEKKRGDPKTSKKKKWTRTRVPTFKGKTLRGKRRRWGKPGRHGPFTAGRKRPKKPESPTPLNERKPSTGGVGGPK